MVCDDQEMSAPYVRVKFIDGPFDRECFDLGNPIVLLDTERERNVFDGKEFVICRVSLAPHGTAVDRSRALLPFTMTVRFSLTTDRSIPNKFDNAAPEN